MRIVFRTEGNHRQGMGDLWGCIALAEECARHEDEALFLISGGEEAGALIKEHGFRLHVVDSLVAEEKALRTFSPDVIVVNKPNSPPEYIRTLKGFAGLVMTMEDVGEGARFADLRVNVLYDAPQAVTDPRYIALRREFQDLHKRPRTIKREVRELLITQGGSDTRGFTPRIIEALEGAACPAHCTVVVGPAFRHERELRRAVTSSTRSVMVVHDAKNMAQLMWEADLAISAGGITLFELACTGTPSLVICAEPFEVETAQRLERAGVAANLGFGGDLDYHKVPEAVDALAFDRETRRRMSARGKQLVDGLGCERTIRLIRDRAVAACEANR